MTSPGKQRAARAAQRLLGHEIGDGRVGPIAPMLDRAMQVGGFADADALLDAVDRGDASAREALIDVLSVSESWFFRTPVQFEAVHDAIGRARSAGRDEVHIWSAGCAGGEEAFSLAIVALEHGAAPPSVRVLATDASASLLAHAEAALYDARAFRGTPLGARDRWFDDEGAAGLRAGARLRALVTFRRHNLAETEGADALGVWSGPYDLVFCRNVLIYFGGEARRRLFLRLAASLRPDGILVLSPSDPSPPDDVGLAPQGTGARLAYGRRQGPAPSLRVALDLASSDAPLPSTPLEPAIDWHAAQLHEARVRLAAGEVEDSRRALLQARAYFTEATDDRALCDRLLRAFDPNGPKP